MPEPIHVAAIDAGSNGIRCLIAAVDESGKAGTLENVREAVRLGEDAFGVGEFQPRTIERAVEAFERFAALIAKHHVTAYRAVATAACRDARNGPELMNAVLKASGIHLELISGIEEAQLVFTGVAEAVDLAGQSAVLIDMGGGSVEITVARDGRPVGCETLPLGPVRLLETLREKRMAEADTDLLISRYQGKIRSLIDAELEEPPALCFGTGGNLETIAKLRVPLLGKVKNGKVKLDDLDPMIEKMLALTAAQRMDRFDLRPDRADVIAIAMIVLRMVLRDINAPRMAVPGVGLKEGLLKSVIAEARRSAI